MVNPGLCVWSLWSVKSPGLGFLTWFHTHPWALQECPDPCQAALAPACASPFAQLQVEMS